MRFDSERFSQAISGQRKLAAPPLGAIAKLRQFFANPQTAQRLQGLKGFANHLGDIGAVSYGLPLFYNMATGEPLSGHASLAIGAPATLALMHPKGRQFFDRHMKVPLLTASALDLTQRASMGHSMMRPDQVQHRFEQESGNLLAEGINALTDRLGPSQNLDASAPVVDSSAPRASLPPFWGR